MGIFDIFNKNKKQLFGVDDYITVILQNSLQEIHYVEGLLKANNIAYSYQGFISATMAYYYSLWLVYLEKETPNDVFEIMKNRLQQISSDLIAESCEKNNLNKDEYVENFYKIFEDATNEIKSSIDGEAFYDKGITVKYLSIFIDSEDVLNLRTQIQIRILQNWVVLVSEAVKKTGVKNK